MTEPASATKPIPEEHALGRYLRVTTSSAFDAAGYRDGEVIEYVWRMLLRFVHADTLYRRSRRTGERLERVMDFLLDAEGLEGRPLRETKRHMGDVCLFFTGLFPESLENKRLDPRYYVSQGKAAYGHVAAIDAARPTARFFRKLNHEFEKCVLALHLERQFMYDSVYQYIGRQYGI